MNRSKTGAGMARADRVEGKPLNIIGNGKRGDGKQLGLLSYFMGRLNIL